ncbi:MAG: bifunctional aldolase/short-chain dehydrogenase [Pseudomonadota bacterium]
MKSLWNDQEAAQFEGDLAQRVYTSRLLGRDPGLVLHGGGNTSVKITETNLVGEREELLYVKGSGWDLVSIEAGGFAPVRMGHLLKLAKLPRLSDSQMVNELKTQCTQANAPAPSVETILHATLPYKYVDHTHADAFLSISNSAHGEALVRELYGADTVIIPYVMPGFDLARLCAEEFARQATADTIGMVLLKHGVFSFGHDARQSYERMITLVARAEEYLQRRQAWSISLPPPKKPAAPLRQAQAELRAQISKAAGVPMLLCHQDNERLTAFAQRDDLARIARQGPATPDHVIRTKRLPLLGREVANYVADYRAYFASHAPDAREPKTMLDPAPRLVLDPELGACAAGRSAQDAAIVGDIYRHTIEIILRAEAIGGYEALPASDIFDMEYWELEQAKLKKGGKSPAFAGEVCLVTGAASGIGKACVDAMLARGAAVVALDRDAKVTELWRRPDVLGLTCDVTDAPQIEQALERGVRRFGGLDMLVLNAGIFPGGCRIDSLDDEQWRKVLSVNLDANLRLMRLAHPLLKCAPNGGRVVVMGSKNVPAPGPGAAAYSASKAALTQVARIAALEWGADRIRINTLHPDCVFDTGIWTEEVLAARAKHYGLSVDEYKRKNILKTEVSSRDVAELCAELCGPLFAKTTGAQVPIDGGNDRVI